jgi:hypothetical protein
MTCADPNDGYPFIKLLDVAILIVNKVASG